MDRGASLRDRAVVNGAASVSALRASVPSAEYVIRKNGYYYRPDAAGYTGNIAEAGRYTLEEAISYSHPNGPDGPRDGITYERAPEPPPVPDFIAISVERGDFVVGPDGCSMFWPESDQGGFNAWHLRVIADELDRRNADWFRQMSLAMPVAQGTPTRSAETTGSVGEADGGPTPTGDAP